MKKIQNLKEDRERNLTLNSMFILCGGIVICSLLAACGGRYSIKAGDDLVASREGATLTTNMVTSEFENPVLTGLVTVPRLRLQSDSLGRPTTCCRRLLMRADQEVFTSPFLSIIGDAVEPNVFSYSVPPVSLPPDGSPIRFALFDDSERIAGSVRLSDRVIVLPVHVHVLTTAGGQVDPGIRREHVLAWFERPAFNTSVQTIHNVSTGITETHIITMPIIRQFYSNVDDIWHQALIQFRLETYDTIENPEVERQIVRGIARTFVPSEIHARFRSIPGIHIYVGRNSDNISPGFSTPLAGQTHGPGCGASVNEDNAIALAWDEAKDGDSRVLAHELGHYLGLEHTNVSPSLECGAPLLDSPVARNLMEISARDSSITSRQAERARTFACMYLRLWGMASPACP